MTDLYVYNIGIIDDNYELQDEELRQEIDDLKDDIKAFPPGLSYEAKEALLNCFEHIEWEDGVDSQELQDVLEQNLYPDIGLASIDVEFDPEDNEIYTDTPLRKLKDYLTVTGYFEDGKSRKVNGYVLKGLLAEGESIITVDYYKKQASFSVNVLGV